MRYGFIQEIKNLPYNISNIYKWSKVLWNNFDWDDTFLLEIISFKLKSMKKYFENDSCIEDSPIVVEQITNCITACDHLITNDFEEKLTDAYYKKYPIDLEHWIEQINTAMTIEQASDFAEMHKIIETKKYLYKELLFNTMRDNIETWWD